MNLLAPFDDETQVLLNDWDNACRSQMNNILAEMESYSLKGETYKMDVETIVWWKGIKAYGILMNRAIDAGWVKGVVTIEENDNDDTR